MTKRMLNGILLVLMAMSVLLITVGSVSAAPSVPAAVADIIADNCVRCHVAPPSGHTGAQDSDQCGLCHVPYGHTTVLSTPRLLRVAPCVTIALR